jgi:uncharacterized protein involved in exopolysaccharide biosynthesis
VITPGYTAYTTFVPGNVSEGINLPGGLAGLASQFGVSIPSGGTSPQFYVDVLESRTVMEKVLQTLFPDPRTKSPTDSAVLPDILDIEGTPEARPVERGRKELDRNVTVNADGETNIVTLSLETHYASLSAVIANYFVRLLNEFNLQTRQTNAGERRRFIEERLTDAEAELYEGEEQLRRFLEQNRRFRGSPELEFQYERLQRQVTIHQEVFTTLRRQYEEARIQEVNDTPVITVIDAATPPQRKSSPRRVITVFLAFVLGAIIALVVAFAGEFLDRAREQNDPAYYEFTSRWNQLAGKFRGLLSLKRAHARSEKG